MDQIDLAGKAGQEVRLFAGTVAATDHADRDIAVKGAIAGRTGRQSTADELLLIRQSEVARSRTSRNDHSLRFKGFIARLEQKAAVRTMLDRIDTGPADARSEFLGLRLHSHHQFGPHDAIRVTWKVLDLGGGGQLAAGLRAGKQKRSEVRTCRVNR